MFVAAANKYGGGNTYNPQPTPEWQKPLTSFFTRLEIFNLILQNQIFYKKLYFFQRKIDDCWWRWYGIGGHILKTE